MRRMYGRACAALAGLAVATTASAALACTRILWNDPDSPGLVGRTMDWPTTTEPVLMDEIQSVMTGKHGARTTVHVAVEDAVGDSAIIEYIGGKPLIHHGRDYRIMTNDPPYDEQLELAGAYDFSQPTSDTPLPGNVNPRDRFARATYFLQIMPAPKRSVKAWRRCSPSPATCRCRSVRPTRGLV